MNLEKIYIILLYTFYIINIASLIGIFNLGFISN